MKTFTLVHASTILFAVVIMLSSACSDSESSSPSPSASEDPTGARRAPAAGCVAVSGGCVCAPGTSSISCGRNQIPTDPDDFREDVYFVTPCCASTGWPSSGSCTCENRVGVKCTTKDLGEGKTQCQCGTPFGGFQSSGATAPTGGTGTSSCSKPSGGKCCALPGPNGAAPYLGCFCGSGASCNEVIGNYQAVEVDCCDGDQVFSPYCPSGTTETGTCGGPPGSGGGGGSSGKSGGCSGNSDCGSCQRCELSTGNCVARLTC